jgi:hypothetical protein
MTGAKIELLPGVQVADERAGTTPDGRLVATLVPRVAHEG